MFEERDRVLFDWRSGHEQNKEECLPIVKQSRIVRRQNASKCAWFLSTPL